MSDLAENAPDGMARLDDEGKILWANRALCRLLGRDRKELAGRSFMAFLSDPAAGRALLEHLESGRKVERFETRLRAHDGVVRHVVIDAGVLKRDGRFIHARCFVRDVTRQTEVETELRRFKFLSDYANDAHFLVDRDGRIVYVNRQACMGLGYGLDQLRRMTFEHVMPGMTPHHLAGLLDRLEEVSLTPFESVHRRADGSMVPVEVSVTGAVFEGRRHLLAVARDITERKQTREKLEQQAAELASRDRRKDEFLAMLAHELRNPLAPVRNAVEILRLHGSELGGEAAWAVGAIDRQMGQLTRLVDDLLDVSRITRGQIGLRRKAAALSDIVGQAVETVQPRLDAKRHRLVIELPDPPAIVHVDPVRLTQVLSNLLDNAAKYTPPRGGIHIAATLDRGELVIRVEDEGVGIAPDVLPRVFETFEQADKSLARSQGGLGLGLALARKLVEMHGGTIEVASAGAGQGSTFTMRLPAGWQEAVEESVEQNAPDAGAGEEDPRRVLVVDDNEDSATSLALWLRARGCDVQTAADGGEALQVIEAFMPSMALLDIGLPGMDGYELARRIRASGAHPGLRLVALTGYGMEDDRARARDAGFDAHMLKPVDLDRLRRMLRLPSWR